MSIIDLSGISQKINLNNDRIKKQPIDKRFILFGCGASSILLYYILPFQFRILAMIISILGLCIVFPNSRSMIVLISGFITLLLPSGAFTLDSGYNIDAILAIYKFERGLYDAVGAIIIGIPTICITIIIIDISIMKFDEALMLGVKTIIIIVMSICVCCFLSSIGIGVFGGAVTQLEGLWNQIEDTVGSLQDFSMNITDISSMLDVQDNMQYVSYGFVSIFPQLTGYISITISIAFLFFDKSLPDINLNIFEKKIELSRPNRQNWEFFIVLSVLMIAIFAFYLKCPVDEILLKSNIGYISIYSIISLVSCILLGLGFGCVAKIRLKYTITGIIIGLFMLSTYTNLFTGVQMDSLNAFALEFESFTHWRLYATWLFVAPTESLLFHVFLPSFVIYLLMIPEKRANDNLIDNEIELYKMKIDTLQTQMIYYQTEKMTGELGNSIEKIESYQKKIKKLRKTKKESIKFESKYMNPTKWIVFLVLSLVFQFLFSSFHYFNSGLDFKTFWLSGLGLIYLLSGGILEYIAIKYDWLSCICVHALNNSIVLLLLV